MEEKGSLKLEIESKVREKSGICWAYIVAVSYLIYIRDMIQPQLKPNKDLTFRHNVSFSSSLRLSLLHIQFVFILEK